MPYHTTEPLIRTGDESAKHDHGQGAGLYAWSDDPDSKGNEDGDELGGCSVEIAMPERLAVAVLKLFL